MAIVSSTLRVLLDYDLPTLLLLMFYSNSNLILSSTTTKHVSASVRMANYDIELEPLETVEVEKRET